MTKHDLIERIEMTKRNLEGMLIRQTPNDYHERIEAFEAIQFERSKLRRLEAELDGTCLPWETVEQIAAYVRGDGTDAQRVALADGILEGRRVD